jgi:hypothetical protein
MLPYPRRSGLASLARRSLALRHRRVLLQAGFVRVKQQSLYRRSQSAQRRYLPTYLKSVLLHFRASLVHSLRRR